MYPWRTTRDPYRILVSEVMLQQTQASRVAPAYRSFLLRFPTMQSLARARLRDVVTAWQGLGYNRRAVALWEAAGTIVRRIVARFFLGAEPDDVSPREVRALADGWLDRSDPGAWNQALMDLGREHCRPRPRCGACPLRASCRFVAEGSEPKPARRRQSAFEGSFRQVRGAVIRTLRAGEDASLATLARETGAPLERVGMAVSALAADGRVVGGAAARAGRPGGRVRLPG